MKLGSIVAGVAGVIFLSGTGSAQSTFPHCAVNPQPAEPATCQTKSLNFFNATAVGEVWVQGGEYWSRLDGSLNFTRFHVQRLGKGVLPAAFTVTNGSGDAGRPVGPYVPAQNGNGTGYDGFARNGNGTGYDGIAANGNGTGYDGYSLPTSVLGGALGGPVRMNIGSPTAIGTKLDGTTFSIPGLGLREGSPAYVGGLVNFTGSTFADPIQLDFMWFARGEGDWFDITLNGESLWSSFGGDWNINTAYTALIDGSRLSGRSGLLMLYLHSTGPADSELFIPDFARATLVGGSAVPEPTTWAMLLFGFGGLGYAMRHRPKASVQGRLA
jgi:hypothetical protein